MDTKLDIAVGLSARSRTWKNQKWTWEQLAEKLKAEHKTNETYKEFVTATKTEQSKIKDVGGYVGGYLRGGRRKPENVLHRQLITLDIDNAHNDFWSIYTMQFGNAAVLHSTHKHAAASPRYRLVMPTSREMAPDEYAAVSRYVAGVLGIDLFDNTTFQSERLMFWPSSSIDAEYVAEELKGPWLDTDEILDSYTDWKDSSAWPTAESTINEVKDASKKLEDPETKRGLIGAFCRSYSISEVIASFLSDEYVDAGEGRYTYTKGSAAAGLIVYDDKFSYSHHGTDPAGSKLLNAFDLVRVHKFGHLDPDGADSTKSKSFRAMEQFCIEDKGVKKTIAGERLSETKYDFSEELEPQEDAAIDWAEDLEVDGKGKYTSSANNISVIFANDPILKEAFKENSFDNKRYLMRSVPWRRVVGSSPVKNVDYSGVRNYIEILYGVIGSMKIEDSLNLEFEKHSFNPVVDFLEGLKWDGVPRIDTLLIDYFGADPTIYAKEAIRKMLVGAVARIFNPGAKFDLVLTLTGSQGTGKSTFISKLGGAWFSDSFHTVNGKEAFEQLQGSWIIEMAELSGMRKSEVETIKHFITKQEDTYRPAFGRITETYKRQCVFFATTNEKDFLRDPSGNRRFLPIDVRTEHASKNILNAGELEGEHRAQVWAEAVELYEAGETLYLSREAEYLARKEQVAHSQQDDRTGLVEAYVNTLLPKDWDGLDILGRRAFLEDPLIGKGVTTRRAVCVAEIWCECLGKAKKDMNRYNTREINDILRTLDGWRANNSAKEFSLYGKQRHYERKTI